jgi:type II secretion system protein G
MTLPSALTLFPSLLLGLALPTPAKEATREPAKNAAVPRAQVQRVEADCQSITAALQMYKLNAGEYPTEKQGLKALVEKPTEAPHPRRWLKLMDKVPLDAWGHEYRLLVRMKNEKPVLVVASGGPDLEALDDDIEIPVEKPEPKK